MDDSNSLEDTDFMLHMCNDVSDEIVVATMKYLGRCDGNRDHLTAVAWRATFTNLSMLAGVLNPDEAMDRREAFEEALKLIQKSVNEIEK